MNSGLNPLVSVKENPIQSDRVKSEFNSSHFLELNDLIVKYGFRPEKKLAQFFIMDESIVEKLAVLAELKKTDVVLEIGSGTGFLTKELQKHCKVIAVEFDSRLFELLEKELPKENLELVQGDFQSVKLPKFNKMVSLPPYTISAGIMFKLLDFETELAVLVFQKEFVQKILAQPGFNEYHPLSVLMQYYYNAIFVQTIPADSFFPHPGVVSAIIKLVSKKRFNSIKPKKAFENFVKTLFRFQNKNLRNALNHSFQFIGKELGLNEKEFKQKIEKLDLKDSKVKLLEVEEFAKLFNEFVKKEKTQAEKISKKKTAKQAKEQAVLTKTVLKKA